MKDAIAFANNDIAYVWWVIPEKIPNCLGFSVRRVNNAGQETALPAFVGFEPGVPGQSHPMQNTDVWPIQAFQWKDVFADPGTYRYRIVPMLGTPDALKPDVANSLETNQVNLTGNYGDFEAYFNVGLISTQAITREIKALVGSTPAYKSPEAVLRGEIAREGSNIRKHLAGQVLDEGLLSLLNRTADEGGQCHLSLYEFTDRQLIDKVEALSRSHQLELCLSNADTSEEFQDANGKKHTRKIHDGTNKGTRTELSQQGVKLVNRFVPSNSIGHNKFVVRLVENNPKSVLTGSTNWTPTGLCSQTNNALIIHNEVIARGYQEYWERLCSDAVAEHVQGTDLRAWCGTAPVQAQLGDVEVKAWFSPNTTKKTKDADEAPPDLADVFELIEEAKHGILFLAFNPGTPSCIEKIREKAESMREEKRPFFVRGAVTDPTPLGQFATFLTKRDALQAPDVLVSGVAGVPDAFGNWEQELYKLGHAVIHDKILVIDPFSKNCVVVTGSHNLGYKASYQNDENLVIIKGHRELAQAYAAHVLDVTNHFAWRSKLTYLNKQGKLDRAWGDLAETDRWQNKYFDSGNSASRDAFFFINP